MNIVFYGASVTAQKEAAGYFYALKSMLSSEFDNIEKVSFAASVFDQAGFAFMREIERLTFKADICVIDWLTPSGKKYNIEKIKTLSKYLLDLGCLPIWVSFPRLDDLTNERECYQQVAKHCEDDNIPFLDVYQDIRISSLPPKTYLRDVVHTTPEGGAIYAQILKEFIVSLNVNECFKKINLDSFDKHLVPPSLNKFDFLLKPNGPSINIQFQLDAKKKFEFYFVAEIGPHTPLINVDIHNYTMGNKESLSINCLDIWSHYNREKCIKVLWKDLAIGKYKMVVSATDNVAIDTIDIKKPVDRAKYPIDHDLELPISMISSNVVLSDFSVGDENV